MRLTLTNSDPLGDAALVDDSTHGLYDISFNESNIIISKESQKGTPHVQLAEIERVSLINWNDGRQINVEDWLKKGGALKRTLSANSGKQYRWQVEAGGLKLLQQDYKRTAKYHEVARYHDQSMGFLWRKAHDAYIDLNEELLPMEDLDEIVVSFIYLRVLRGIQTRMKNRALVGGLSPVMVLAAGSTSWAV